MEKKASCCGCTACKMVCPQQCIEMEYDEEGFIYPIVDNTKCIHCGVCKNICPFEKNDTINEDPIAIAAFCKDEQIRYESSSGGVFTILATNVIEHGGIVCGAIFDSNTKKVKHFCVDTVDGLKVFRGSKYIQSELGNLYNKIQYYLAMDRKVLFSGTSCQVAGLKAYLRKEYENLVCVEVICHGVPSTKLWKNYVNYVEKKKGKIIDQIYFRSKKYSLGNYNVRDRICNKTDTFQFAFENSFFRLFNSNICLRPSCYECKVKGKNTKADISLGDFWHIDEIYSDLDDGKGISLVLLCTEKGKQLFKDVSDNMMIYKDKIDYRIACKCNPAVINTMTKSDKRDEFFKDLCILDYDKLVKKYSPKTGKIILKGILLRIGIWKIIQKLRNGHEVNNGEYGIRIILKNDKSNISK